MLFLACVLAAAAPTEAAAAGRGLARRAATLPDPAYLRVATWNVAAINNNPFEYWITHDDPKYNQMMQDVQAFLDEPGAADVAVSTAMLGELQAKMTEAGWDHVDEAVAEWRSQYAGRQIIAGFMKDKDLGKKRLMSMPDRTTNTINLASGQTATRPTAINCYGAEFASMEQWWAQWKGFMFDTKLSLASGKEATPSQLVGKISRAKYPALTEAEEAMSRPLSAICQAAFDGILVHMLNTVGGGAHKETWQPMRRQMCVALNSRKTHRTLAILSRSYADSDAIFLQEIWGDEIWGDVGRFREILGDSYADSDAIFLQEIWGDVGRYGEILGDSYADSDAIFLQEVSGAMVAQLREHPKLSRNFSLHVAPNDGKRDQISVLLLSRSRFDPASATSLNPAFDALLAGLGGDVPVWYQEPTYVLASFHGDTDGLATVPVVKAMAQLLAKQPAGTRHVFGMDANTYAVGSAKQQGVSEFAAEYRQLGLTSCWGDAPDPTNITTFNARTYLQPQLNKAVAYKDLASPGTGDKNPKDFLLFPRGSFGVESTTKDNTGQKAYVERQPFPTLTFPSDHGVLSSVLKLLPPPSPLASELRTARRSLRAAE
ncbi:hypothetical protein EMIHUDRAFT_461998 [Emiliania huxleyi CCMP1516]|uniref:Endonuclease/exonuclease/phosphatase domain-containing protein n=2 Tax=Emiliania huxleyi TaxID=2903 RepID=A0A0D3I2E6_EMIH1|nr:hypothetical protein EMIHUDRAFT_461998 [Emiliania huxleyi CCMP1516]EOD05431.1 hypothetical protein EMIHUDRAFT_461998 [Emiliania huxleyi CCMP1516]|eukprot:XP_005757860.1 hypothetical protein EMIHUDRAFT_461998 [Emiliania huxleyi CCMP1516]